MKESKVTKEEYNSIPVKYCTRCLSLKIRAATDDCDYCDKCGSTDVAETDIETWKGLYKEKYGKNLIEEKNGEAKDGDFKFF